MMLKLVEPRPLQILRDVQLICSLPDNIANCELACRALHCVAKITIDGKEVDGHVLDDCPQVSFLLTQRLLGIFPLAYIHVCADNADRCSVVVSHKEGTGENVDVDAVPMEHSELDLIAICSSIQGVGLGSKDLFEIVGMNEVPKGFDRWFELVHVVPEHVQPTR